MNPKSLFYVLIFLIISQFIWHTILDYLNAKCFNKPIPQSLKGIFNDHQYQKSQNYKISKYRFAQISNLVNLMIVLSFFFIDGFAWVDQFVRQYTNHPITTSLLYIGILTLANNILDLPFSYYHTFVIEQNFGFNTTTTKTFWLDQIKNIALSIFIGAIILTVILWFYHKVENNFWWYTWVLITSFTLFFTFFYAQLIVPIFNKQTPLTEGELKQNIYQLAQQTGFKIENIFVIDGSKRSKKANAYFTGFGNKKRIVLYDTLINNLTINQIIAVIAHEIGHYKRKHIIYNIVLSTIITGITLYILSFFISNPVLSQALGIAQPNFHIGIIAFSILYSPLSETTGLLMNILSRRFEYQADNYAKQKTNANDLINALKTLSKNALTNLTPHPLYVLWHYSHPTLLQRINNLKNNI